MRTDTTIFYDVDTQRDFLAPGGALYLPDAEQIVTRLKEVTHFARETKVRVVCALDLHNPGDPMLKSWGGQLPDHCIVGTPGAEKIDATRPLNAMTIGAHELSQVEIQAALDHKGELLFNRQKFEALADNAHAHSIMRLVLRPFSDIVMYGVYLDLCVERAIHALIGLGPKLHIISDAIAIVNQHAADSFDAWRADGIDLVSMDTLKTAMLNQ
jgi:nicotinamidase/pyrazinamidase